MKRYTVVYRYISPGMPCGSISSRKTIVEANGVEQIKHKLIEQTGESVYGYDIIKIEE